MLLTAPAPLSVCGVSSVWGVWGVSGVSLLSRYGGVLRFDDSSNESTTSVLLLKKLAIPRIKFIKFLDTLK